MKQTISASLPASLTYIPLFREFVSDVLIRAEFSKRFAYRTEIIVDELCSNAIKHGSHDAHSRIELKLSWDEEHIDLSITDEGGNADSVKALQQSIKEAPAVISDNHNGELSLGLEIVKTLAEQIEVTVTDENITSVHVTRRREEM